MNQRISELVRESTLDQYGLGRDRYRFEYTAEKFAALIIADVLNLCGDEILSQHYLDQPEAEDAIQTLRSRISDHFGVEP